MGTIKRLKKSEETIRLNSFRLIEIEKKICSVEENLETLNSAIKNIEELTITLNKKLDTIKFLKKDIDSDEDPKEITSFGDIYKAR